jgi:hypothetical protein
MYKENKSFAKSREADPRLHAARACTDNFS